MISKLQDRHTSRTAYVYIRQSTMGQVRHHRESTERQYALRDKALELGWSPASVRILDRDLGESGAQAGNRRDFQLLIEGVSAGKAGAVFALEASRLARSCVDFHRLIRLCGLTDTLVIDEDGCYDPADFNDGLLLGLKGTIAQAELHFIRARLQGGKLNKARKGELRFPLPVGLCYDEQGRTVPDPDQEVQGAVGLVFSLFCQTGSAYGVVQHFARQGLPFPKRSYGGLWAGRLIWGRLTHSRVLGILKNPAYAGAYVYGRYRSTPRVGADGSVKNRIAKAPMDSWLVRIQDHHPGYIGWDQFVRNQQRLEKNRTNGEETLSSEAAREGRALLQGLLMCGNCGRRLGVRYTGNGGLYPVYQCNWLRREGRSTRACMNLRCDLLDEALSERVLQVIEPAQIEIAWQALQQLEQRDEAVLKQRRMQLERAEYEAQLAQRRYQEVDPANRLVAATLERGWNDALVKLQEEKRRYAEFEETQARATTPQQKARVLALAKDFPRLWKAPSTRAKDKKRMLRLLIKDITVRKTGPQAVLHTRWQGGACEDIRVALPMRMADRVRYPEQTLQLVRELARNLPDDQVANALNRKGCLSPRGKAFTASMIKWIRYRYRIPAPELKRPGELTVRQLSAKFAVSPNVVYYWIQCGVVQARRLNRGSPYWIALDAAKEEELMQWVRGSSRIQSQPESRNGFQTPTVGGAI